MVERKHMVFVALKHENLINRHGINIQNNA